MGIWNSLMYEKGQFIGAISRGIVFVLSLWIFWLFIGSSAIAIEAMVLFWLPAFPFMGMGLSNNITLLLTTCMWFLIGCGVNMILYIRKNNQKQQQ